MIKHFIDPWRVSGHQGYDVSSEDLANKLLTLAPISLRVLTPAFYVDSPIVLVSAVSYYSTPHGQKSQSAGDYEFTDMFSWEVFLAYLREQAALRDRSFHFANSAYHIV